MIYMEKTKKLGNKIAQKLADKQKNSDVVEIKQPLEEATVADLANEEDAITNGEGESIYDLLDEKYAGALRQKRMVERAKKNGKFVGNVAYGNNILFIGPTGVGKTSIVRKWANDHNLRLVALNLTTDYLDFSGVVDIDRSGDSPKAYTVGTRKFDALVNGPDTVLFIDEINKANGQVLKQCYSIISEHKVINGDEEIELNSLLFTVAAMNPESYGDREPLDKALQARLEIVQIGYNTEKFKEYMLDKLNSEIEDLTNDIKQASKNNDEQELQELSSDYEIKCKQKEIAEKLLEDPKRIKWPSADEVTNSPDEQNTLNPRTLDYAISNCDGTVNGFINICKRQCGIMAANQLYTILGNFKPSNHKANAIWDKDYEVKPQISSEEKKKILNDESDMANYNKNSLFGKVLGATKNK